VLSHNRPLQRIVAVKLQQDWSPQQIAGWLRDHYPGDVGVTRDDLSKPFCTGARCLKKKVLIGHLRTKRRFRRSRHATYKGQGRGAIIDAISIRERPAEVEDRAVPGAGLGKPRRNVVDALDPARELRWHVVRDMGPGRAGAEADRALH
jgi:IS30 family transposase